MIQLSAQLKGVPLFSSLSDEQLDTITRTGAIRRYHNGHIVVQQSNPGDTFFIVVSGCVKVTLLSKDGKEIILSVLKKGDFFGELSLMDNEPRSANVIVVEDSTLFQLTQKQFHQLITTYPDILKKVLKELCTRLRHADEKIGGLAFLDAYGRTISVVLQLAHERGIKTKTGIEISCAPTHQELSSMVGVSRETITRIIKVLKENKTLISYRGRKVVLERYPESMQCEF
ncbi:MAG: Crp/Fnr family transcriptional regulator [Planctomycetes bacterium]|nr:Crp/Fnr family transcriptional regulator [Planctomycetota bacterium]